MQQRHDIQIATAFFSGVAIALGAAYLYLRPQLISTSRSPALPEDNSNVEDSKTGAFVGALEDEILREHFTRNIQFFGPESQDRVFNAFVAVVGLGVRPSAPCCLLCTQQRQ